MASKSKNIEPKKIEAALSKVTDEASFLQHVLIDLLDWPIDSDVKTVADITYDWSKDDLKASDLDKKVLDGQVRQLVLKGCPWGIFIVEFKNPDVFTSGRGMTVPLRQILSGLVPKQKKSAHLPSFFREHLLFICTHRYQYFRFVHFKAPGSSVKQPILASFGWRPGDSTKTVSTYNLPHLAFLDAGATVDDWIATWTKAFDVERVTKKFYLEYKDLHKAFADAAQNVPHANDRPWLASVVLNRLMFVYFLQRKGFVDGGKQNYLEEKLATLKKAGKDRVYDEFLSLLFFEGFAKPEEKRSAAAKKVLGNIRYLNGGLFLEHPIEQAARKAGKPVNWPDAVFDAALRFFGSFSWNLNDVPGGEDNEINPDVLGYILEKYVNQKSFGAYYTRPEITGYLCEHTVHRLVLDAVNTPDAIVEAAKLAGLPVRRFDTVAHLLKKLDDNLATRLLDSVLPSLSLLDPACGSGAFLVGAMKTLIDLYASVFSWIEFHGNAGLKSRLATIREDHASLDYFIKHRIITDNLYGVDLMPEAVEIARLRLFLSLAASVETVDQLEPLPNIDFNVMPGNSLIGLLHVDPKKVSSSNIFDKPYDEIVADRDRRLDTYRHTAAYADDLTALRDGIASINANAQQLLDLLLLGQFESLGIKFEQATWDDAKNQAGKPKKRPLLPADIVRLAPFHWAFAFSRVMSRGGFDAIITNPPWEVLKPNGKEFFEGYSDVVTKKSMTIHDFEAEQERLLKDNEIRLAWLDYLSTYRHQSAYFRAAPEYRHQSALANGKRTSSDLNLYKLFVERCFRLLRPGGQCGIVVPTAVYSDLGSKGLREMMFTEGELDSVIGLSNEKWIFEGVHHDFRFCLLVFGRGGMTSDFDALFRFRVEEAMTPTELGHALDTGEPRIRMTLDEVKHFAPATLSIRELRGEKDRDLTYKMLRFPTLGEDVAERWKLTLTNEFHMTADSDLHLYSQAGDALPLVEGKMIDQFEVTPEEATRWVSKAAAHARLLATRQREVRIAAKRLSVCPSDDLYELRLDYESYRFAFRDVGNSMNERSMIATVLPPDVFCPHTVSLEKVFLANDPASIDALNRPAISSRERLFLCGVCNSFVIDAWLKRTVAKHVSFYFVYSLPVPRLRAADAAFGPIVERVAKLICTTPAFDDMAREAGLNPPDHTAGVTDPNERAALRAELDAMVAHLYGLTDEQFAHVLETFPLVDSGVRQATMNEFTRMVGTGEATTFNPDLAKPAAVADPSSAVKDLIANGESASLEFKSTARWNVKANMADAKMERVIVKTVAAFLNTRGGTLIIGVEDDGNICGLHEDYKLCANKGRDGFENWLMQTLMKDFGKDAAARLQVEFHQLGRADEAKPGSADVCVLSVEPSPKPRFAQENGQELFYVRTGNATNALKPSEMVDYIKQRWPEVALAGA